MKLKIGGNVYTVRMVAKKDLDDDSGECDTELQLIRIARTHKKAAKRTTLLHEVLHAINIVLEEEQVEFLSQALNQVLVDNPHFTKLFLEQDDG